MSVIKDSRATGGLFAHYDAALEACQPALTGSAGTSAKQLAAPPQPAERDPRRMMAAAVVAAGIVRLLGGAVESYNRRIDGLNTRWRAAKASSFGVPPPAYPDDADETAIKRATVDHADRLLDAKLELLDQLEREYHKLRPELDAAIDVASARLAEGPSEGLLRDLHSAGVLPVPVLRALSRMSGQ